MSGSPYSIEQAVVNRIWCQTILEELSRFGVSEVCVAPGSRSTPLTLEADENPNLTLHTHFDERGLGFLALGLAKASRKPVAVVVTSGTAVANLLPAIAEAKLTGEKLVVLTADRPVELVGCGANQAINQSGIFSSHVTASLELPSPSLTTPLKWLLTSVDNVMHSQAKVGCAVHINCPFPEPLYSAQDKSIYQDYIETVSSWWQSNTTYTRQLSAGIEQQIHFSDFADKKGAIVLGSVTLSEARLAKQLAEKLGWPLLSDPQSGVTSAWAHYDLWLQNGERSELLNQCELVLQIGSRIVSKRLNQWLVDQVEQRNAQYHYLAPSADRNNQSHLMQTHHVADIKSWLQVCIESIPVLCNTESGWANELTEVSQQVANLAALHLNADSSLDEIELALSVNLVAKQAQIFLGNSLFVRLVDMFSGLDDYAVYSNRGASGIDGLIATASGVVRANQQPTLVYIGDTSLLYDINSLALLTHEKTPVVVVVTNNDGGAIFDLLPVPEQQKQSLYQMPHGYDFECAAKQFKLSYSKPETLAHYTHMVNDHLRHGEGALLVEVQTPPEQASSQLKEFIQQIHAL
ncbi:2-succinyl-5-enolpyruvyl-6-hydroxy-3-cyclohexene-1-carboxylic-acid synthase [Vibrio tubiashii]|uniref:2-succinyl-5-enolpyruvyl-6-hydroxy-3-cyclohexene-1-carboxylate synthase n=1 Tax=Vibrio tubiashii ATCC 19109 TaxID=1051646 RepID=F9T9R5_9VIBR|nr:2-succinyl-5-enolpyruvyl-6-hydroxy-3-cyclohexene-1-carboxylic-acid synthase [Vibrio tubiashii]AIW14534.1 2-succinyl-5-enolpyruvyl-6-hydroxy-3-cyclohexene-1-carboxylate synthase [Vibrio tubiashii ATCC 19109]EGU51079.1 2-succinyl-5-enolpyruvyl-6-hydroxy-3-cyclohexene-1-carboxylate synthase [Vibrio tubiashii ATCC 19109]EIF04095.1 2-succinyl-5-enolpyruvyl-6-hydroxy-3-cyclohexene-1-carboxylate synthase [Vibrio tubiashii NCIMB 1337 = ATCC 19106]